MLPQAVRAAVIEFDFEAGLFEARWLDTGMGSRTQAVVRILRTDAEGITVCECPAVRGLTGCFTEFANARQQRVWGRTPAEVLVAAESATTVIRVQGGMLSAEPIYVATPPHTPPLLTLVETERVITCEMALITKSKVEPLPTTPMSTVLNNMRRLALEMGKVTKMAQLNIKAAIISHALQLGYDTHSRMITVVIPHFGLRKLFSLDIADCIDIVNTTTNEVGYVFKSTKEELVAEGAASLEAIEVMDTIDCRGLQLNKLDKKGNKRFTKYLTFAEHPDHANEMSYNLASKLPGTCRRRPSQRSPRCRRPRRPRRPRRRPRRRCPRTSGPAAPPLPAAAPFSLAPLARSAARRAPGLTLALFTLLCAAAEVLTIKVAVRWWDASLEQYGGVPLMVPPQLEGRKFAVLDDTWHDKDDEPFVNLSAIQARFPLYQDKHYR